jgi:protocatechuate 3,4-dioxygenase beta subunit
MSRSRLLQLPTTQALNRREMLKGLAGRAVTVVVSQSMLGCATASIPTDTAVDTTSQGGSASSACVLTAALTQGPFFVDEKLNRADIRSDPVSGMVSAGVPLGLTFNVSRVASNACAPLTGAYLDVWHADASGTYSDVSGMGNGSAGAGHKFLRGYQITDAAGAAQFATIYPGWYSGRAVHVHFKLRLYAGSSATYEFTSQFFMVESITSTVHAIGPYNTRGQRNVMNPADGIYNGLTTAQKSALTLQTTKTTDGYSGIINLDVNVG